MTFHQLRIFAAVAKHLNMTRASNELRSSQPSISQQLKLLEEECGAKLYKKIGRGIELTEEGRQFLNDVEPILMHVERLRKKFSADRLKGKPASLTVGGSHSPSASFLPMLSAIYKETHPLVGITLRTDTSRGIERLILDGQAEIGVITSHSGNPSLAIRPCREERLVLFGPARHLLTKKESLTLAELVKAPMVIKKGREGEDKVWQMISNLEKQGHKLNIVMYCESPDAAKAAVKRGVGLGILYHEIVEPEIKRGELKIIKIPEINMKTDTYVVYHRERPLSPYAEDFLTLLHEWPQKIRPIKAVLRVG